MVAAIARRVPPPTPRERSSVACADCHFVAAGARLVPRRLRVFGNPLVQAAPLKSTERRMRLLLFLTLVPLAAFAQVTKTTTSVALNDLCLPDATYQVDVYTPAGAPPFPAVALGHGYQNSKDNEEGLARQLAAAGILVVAPQFPIYLRCGTADHSRNATILLAALDAQVTAGAADATRLGLGGHSAGGLAALLAAARREVRVVVQLDGVDVTNLGLLQAGNVHAPTLFLRAEPATCNYLENGTAWYAPQTGPKAHLTVTGAAHCDPQEPESSVCSLSCGGYSAARSAVFKQYADAFFRRYLLGQTLPCIETTAAADNRVRDLDFQLEACGADAGTPFDAGTSRDAGSVDAGARADAGLTVDAGATDAGPSVDGGNAADAGPGSNPTTPATGCGCATGSADALVAIVALVLARRARRSKDAAN
jgi:MYXO-CTERM domain-containing protein